MQEKQRELIQQELNNLLKTNQQHNEQRSLWHQQSCQPEFPNQYHFTHYQDKQLNHLIISQEFDFPKIAHILNCTFPYRGCSFTEEQCRSRWMEICITNPQHNKKKEQKEQKRLTAIRAMTDPFSLYSLSQRLQEMEKQQAQAQNAKHSYEEPQHQGYSIFKDRIREIPDTEEYYKRYQKMKLALKQVEQSKPIAQKPILFKPQFNNEDYTILEEQLTVQKVQQLLNTPQLPLEHYQRQLKENNNFEQRQTKIMKQCGRMGYSQREGNQNQGEYDFDDNWDEYQSD